MQNEINFGCSEEFAELCALSTAASLSVAEEEQLEAHVAVCAQCALLLNQYQALTSAGMAKVAARREREVSESGDKVPNADRLKAKLFSSLRPLQAAHAFTRRDKLADLFVRLSLASRFSVAAVVAIVLVTFIAGYLLGTGNSTRQTHSLLALSEGTEATLKSQLVDARSQLAAVKQELIAASANADALQFQSEEAEKHLRDVENRRAALEATIQPLTSDNQRKNAALADLTAERDTLIHKLQDSETLLQSVRQDLKAAQEDRQRFLLRATSLESQVDQLSAEVRERDQAARRSEQYLASDRDVRELMGARQLYIADVFDVDPQGQTRKPFGRIFYTKGKSLIFYAFDLDKQPGYKEARAFQAWGRPGSSHATPVSLGIFYLDSEKNRRWALKFEDPKVLEEINALFVTLEPTGGSKQPTNKPFLLAYLHTATANHP